MDYNGLCKSILLLKLENGEYVPLASVLPSYGPFNSMSEALADLGNTFRAVTNVPRGYTFCLIENGKPQEYWFTKEGDVNSIEKKNTSSSSTVISGVQFRANDDDKYIQVSYDGGNTWTNLVSYTSITGPRGYTGATGASGSTGAAGKDADLTKIKINLSSSNGNYVLKYSVDGGVSWTNIGTILGSGGSGGGSGVVGIKTWEVSDGGDGNKYWTLDGNFIEDDEGNYVRANGIDGKDGEDGLDGVGAFAQFKSIVFKRYGQDPNDPPAKPTGGSFEYPTPVNEGWSDGIPPVNGTDQILWMTSRWFFANQALTDVSVWSDPVQATDTADIDFEWSNTPVDEDPGTPTTKPNVWFDPKNANWPGDEYMNWMAIRTAKNGYWSPWVVSKIRGEDGNDGISPVASFTSVIFKRSNNIRVVNTQIKLVASEYPTGGEYLAPLPTNDVYDASTNPTGWSDGIPPMPSGSTEIMLWMSTRKFNSDGTSGNWSEPVQAKDSSDYDYEWCDAETPLYAQPTRTSPDDANPGSESDDTRANGGWYDEPTNDSNPYWMAIRKCSSPTMYEWSYWQVMRVRGEKGDAGTSFKPKGTVFGIFPNIQEANSYYSTNKANLTSPIFAIVGANRDKLYRYTSNSNTGTEIAKSTLTIGDAYTNIADGHVYIWDGDNFIDFGQIQGPEGVGTYFHVKFSNDGGANFTQNAAGEYTGETPGDYIGIRVDHVDKDSTNPSDYIWHEWKGEDGFGYEYIFTLTATNEAPNVPVEDINTAEYQKNDHKPDGWDDDPMSPYKDRPYCWVCYRRKENGVWQPWKGRSSDNTKAGLFAMYSSKGRGIESVTEMYAVSSDTVAPEDSQFSTTVPEFDITKKQYLWNYEIINYDDGTSYSTPKTRISAAIQGRGIVSVTEYYYASPEFPPMGSTDEEIQAERLTHLPTFGTMPDSKWKTNPKQVSVDKSTPWLWNFEVINWTEGPATSTEPIIIAYYLFTDVEYLKNVFKKVDGDENSAQVGGVVMAVDGNQMGTAMLSGKSGEDWGETEEHGRLFIAAGMKDGTTTKERIDASTFKVYEDGHVEALDVELRGYLGQYFRRDIDVCDGTGTNKYIKTKTNFLTVGWKGLQYTDENGETVNFSSTLSCSLNINNLGGFPEGKIIVSNQFYMDSTGRMYYNSNRRVSIIGGIIIAQDSSVLYPINSNIETIYLRNGWVELTKVGYLDKDGKVIVSNTAVARTVYMITAYGGEVFTTNNRQRFVTDSNGAITNYAAEQERASVRNFEFTDGMEDDYNGGNFKQNVLKLYPTNKYIKCTYDATERAYGATGYNEDDELYIVLPALFTATTPLRPIVPLGDMKFTILVSNPLPIIKLRTSTAELYSSITASSNLASLTSPRVWGAVGFDMGISTGPSDSRKLIIEITKDPTGDISDWIVDARFLPA